MTLKEIASKVGVSISTVSRVINKNDEKCASKEVRDKIWEIVKSDGYTPNKNAQSLKKGVSTVRSRQGRLACIFARRADAHNEQFFQTLHRVAEQEAFRHNYFIKHTFALSQIEELIEKDLIKQLELDGIMVLGRLSRAMLTLLRSKCKHIIYVGLNQIDLGIDQVICDGYKAAKATVSYLYSMGHNRIGYIGEMSSEIRYLGYEDTMRELRLPLRKDNIIDTDLTVEGGYRGGQKLVTANEIPTGVFCANDITAIGVIRAIKEKGLRVPEDISIISIDNIEMSGYISTMLTTVDVPLEEMGKMAVKMLIDHIEGGHKLPVKAELPFRIIERDSCMVRV